LIFLLPGAGTVFTTYMPPLVIGIMIQRFGDTIPSDINQFTPYLLLFAGSWVIGEILLRFAFLTLNNIASRGMSELYIDAMETLFEKDSRFFSDNFAGSLTKKAINYARSFERFMDALVFSAIGDIIPLIVAGIVLWQFSPWLDILLFGMLLMSVAVITPFIKRRQKIVIEREVAGNELAGLIADAIGNASTVRAFAQEANEQTRHGKLTRKYTRLARKSWDYHAIIIDSITAPMNIIINVLGFIIAVMLTDNANNLAAVFVTFTYFMQATKVMFEFNRTYRDLESSLSEAAQFAEIKLEPARVTDQKNASDLIVSKAEINFSAVIFAHEDNTRMLFDDLSFAVKNGEKIGIIGHSGAVKSTITNLLLRFMDVDGGTINIDGQDISKVTQRSLRRNIAYVAQESLLFHRSLAENIRYGKPDATLKQVEHAAKLANADEFIADLPDGYETMVGERGIKLSGGQRQRVAIARAILKDAPILLLDEATSALDSESEKLIQDALEKLMRGKTSIVIAHRLSTIQKMDRIIVLDNGKIIEQGSHKSLLAKKGQYAKLWAHQSGGFLREDD
jgi:ATP-binding cassette subfamily B protein